MFSNDEDNNTQNPSSSSNSNIDDASSCQCHFNDIEFSDCQNLPAEHIREKLTLEIQRYYDDYINIKRVGIDPEAGGTITDIDAMLDNNGKLFPITIICQHPSFIIYSTTTEKDDIPIEVSDWISSVSHFGSTDECQTLSALLQFGYLQWSGKNNNNGEEKRSIQLSPKLCRTSSSRVPDELFARARYLHGVGRREEALNTLLEVLELDPTHTEAREYFSNIFDEVARSSTNTEVRTPPPNSNGSASSSSSSSSTAAVTYHHAATAPVHRASSRRRSNSSAVTGGRSVQGRSTAARDASSPADSILLPDGSPPLPPDSTTTASQWSSRSTTPTSGCCLSDYDDDDDAVLEHFYH